MIVQNPESIISQRTPGFLAFVQVMLTSVCSTPPELLSRHYIENGYNRKPQILTKGEHPGTHCHREGGMI